MTDETAGALTALTRVESLDLRFTPITNAGILRLSAAMPHLARCVIDGCPITSLGIWRLLAGHRKLKLWLAGARQQIRTLPSSPALCHVGPPRSYLASPCQRPCTQQACSQHAVVTCSQARTTCTGR